MPYHAGTIALNFIKPFFPSVGSVARPWPRKLDNFAAATASSPLQKHLYFVLRHIDLQKTALRQVLAGDAPHFVPTSQLADLKGLGMSHHRAIQSRSTHQKDAVATPYTTSGSRPRPAYARGWLVTHSAE